MPTQDERLIVIEQRLTTFEKDIAANIREVDENTTIMLGVIRHQGQDIKRIFERLETIDQRLDRLEEAFREQKALLTEILSRLPKNP